MSYTVTVWPLPPGAAAPADAAVAEALLERQRQARAPVRDFRFPAFGAALYERFLPSGDDVSPNDAWGDGSEAGETGEPTLTFAFNTQGRHFDAAYVHAVACARSVGLNLYDHQSGEHFLADGRRFPEGRSFDAVDALAAFRKSDWKTTWAELREAAAEGSPEALHDLGFLLREGVGLERLHIGSGRPHLRRLAAAVMQEAAARDEPRRRQRLALLHALPAFLREQVPALRARLQAPDARARLAALDAAIAESAQRRRALLQLPWGPTAIGEAKWLALRDEAWDGDAPSASRLAQLLWPRTLGNARPPLPVTQDGRRRYLELAADAGDGETGTVLAGELLRGEEGWPLDPATAVYWLRRAVDDGSPYVGEMAQRLQARLAAGWDAAADRALAEPLLRETGARRLAALRRACELDHPEAWRRMGDAYFTGDMGLPKDPILSLTMHLVAHKEFAVSDSGIRHPPPARKGMDPFDAIEALRFVRRLVGHTDPWAHVARWRKAFDESAAIQVGVRSDGTRAVNVIPSPAAARAGRRQAAQAAAPPRRAFHRGHVLLVLGALGPLALLALAGRMTAAPARVALLGFAVMAAWGAWRVAGDRGWGLLRRVTISVSAAVPLVGLFAAAVLLLRR